MSGEAIRDVVIRIRMEVANAKLPAPDTSAYKQAMDQLKGASGSITGTFAAGGGGLPPGFDQAKYDDLMKRFGEAFEANDQEAIATLHKEVNDLAAAVKAEIDAEKRAQQERDQLAKEAVAAYSKIMREKERAAAQEQKIAERTAAYAAKIDPTGGNVIVNVAQRNAAATNRLEQATLQNMAAQKQQLEVFSGLGEAAIRFGRGLAFVTAANEDELRATLKYVAAAQGVSDLLVGAINLHKQLAAAKYAVAVAARTQAAAEAASAAAGLASSGSAAKALTVVSALHPALRVVSIVLGVAAAGLYLFRDRADEAANSVDGLEGNLNRLANRGPQFIKGVGWINNAANDLQKLKATSQGFLDQWKLITDQISLQQQTPGFDIERDGDAQIDRIRSKQENRAAFLQNLQSMHGVFGEGELGQAHVEAQIAQEAEDAQRMILSIQQQQTKEMERQQSLAAQQLNSAKQAVEAEKAKLQSQEEKIGRLNPGEQSRLRDIAEKQKRGGELTRQEAEFLERIGIGTGKAGAFFRKEGQKAGAAGILEGLDENKGLEEAQRNVAAAQATFGEASRELQTNLDQLFQSEIEGARKLAKLMEEKLASQERVRVLEDAVKEIDRRDRARGLAGKPRA